MSPLLAKLSMDFAANTPIESITLYLFFAATVAMGAATVYFLVERSSLPPRYQSVMTVAALVTGIACYHYIKMTEQYMAGGNFPTALRYVDWLFTTPLLLIKFPLLLQLGSSGKKFFLQLVALDVAMIVTAFIAETAPLGGSTWWTFFLIACGFELLIVAVLYLSLGGAIQSAPESIASALRTMRLFILIGWGIYPIGFLLALLGAGEYREIAYNFADVINKVGFGLVAYAGVKALVSKEESALSHRKS
ncbi:MAG: rhodopsin [Planctomycetaceae bacterium]|nr:rhodopsin [Gemmataceae bacterium]PHX63106.1 MAG: rhodopsin [Planctomycetaceae bacterium]